MDTRKLFIYQPEQPSFVDAINARKISEPFVYAGNLSDTQLIEFLEKLAVDLKIRSAKHGEPERLRERAEELDKEIADRNEVIDSVVVR